MKTKYISVYWFVAAVLSSVCNSQDLLPSPTWSTQLVKGYSSPSFSRSARAIQFTRGIARWDDDHFIVFEVTPSGQLERRSGSSNEAMAWRGDFYLFQTKTGLVERSWSIPLRSGATKIAVVLGGVVVGEVGKLRFFTRAFTELAKPFYYSELAERHQDIPLLSVQPNKIFVAPDQLHFAIVDKDAAQANITIFDGMTFEGIMRTAVNGLHVSEFSIGGTGFMFSDNETRPSVHIGTFRGPLAPWVSQATPSANVACYVPVYLTADAYIDVCGGITEITKETKRVIFPSPKREALSGPVALSREGATLAILGTKTRGGGIFDTNEVQTALTLHTVSLSNKRPCLIPLGNPNSDLVAFEFVDDQSIAVLNENTVSLYPSHCDP